MTDYAVLANAVVARLLEAQASGAQHAAGQSPKGGSGQLTSDGIAGSIPTTTQRQTICELRTDEPRSYVVSMTSQIQELAPPVFGAGVWPWAKWVVSWGVSAALLETEVDGFSDQFLTVFGNWVRVDFMWDLEAFVKAIPANLNTLPRKLRGSAGIARSEGAVTQAARSYLVTAAPAAQVLPVPYAAVGATMRDPNGTYVAPIGGTILEFRPAGATILNERYDAGAVANAHQTGTFLSVPSMSDEAVVLPAAGAVGQAFLEYILRP